MELHIEQLNETDVRLVTEPAVLFELHEAFSFQVPGAKFTPKFKAGVWDGMIRLVNLRNNTAPKGLVPDIIDFCEGYDYKVTVDPELAKPFREEVPLDWKSLKLPFEPRDFQERAVSECLRKKRQVILSSTGSGKSLIIYALARALQAQGKKILIVVPTIGLVDQMIGDFDEYAQGDDTWDAATYVHGIHGGKDKDSDKPIVVSTWQSIYKETQKFFGQFDAVFADEVHTFTANSCTSIMNKSVNAFYRFGFTGTLEESKTHEMSLRALFGPVCRVSSTSDLMERGILANLTIKPILLKHPDDECKGLGKLNYHDEMDYIVTHHRRNKFIANLARHTNGNILIMFQYVQKHGIPLRDLIKEKVGENKDVHLIYGGTNNDQRNAVRHLAETNDNLIILASYQLFQAGVNIVNLPYIMFASPTKSKIRVLQSIGRALRRSDDKQTATLFDLADDLKGKRKKNNYTLEHFLERYATYTKEGFKVKMTKVDL